MRARIARDRSRRARAGGTASPPPDPRADQRAYTTTVTRTPPSVTTCAPRRSPSTRGGSDRDGTPGRGRQPLWLRASIRALPGTARLLPPSLDGHPRPARRRVLRTPPHEPLRHRWLVTARSATARRAAEH